MKKFTKYNILDTYEGDIEIIGVADNDRDAYNIFAQRVLDTDGECYLSYAPIDTVDTEFETVLMCARNAVWKCFDDDCLDAVLEVTNN